MRGAPRVHDVMSAIGRSTRRQGYWMSFLATLKRWIGLSPADAMEPEFDPGLFVYVRLPGCIEPQERGERFADPIDAALGAASLGVVSGGGSSLSDERPDGSRVVEWCGLDIDVTDLHAALAVLRATLLELDAPDLSELQYTDNGVRLRDQLRNGVWATGERRTGMHPGFDV